MQAPSSNRLYLLLAVLILIVLNVFVFFAVFASHGLTVSVLNIGQGDAILVRGPTGVTMLVDGGPDASVLRELGAVLPLWVRHIDALVETQPDKDHIAGFLNVLNRYDVDYLIEPKIQKTTAVAAELTNAAAREPGLINVVARRGMRVNLGGGAYADILYPDRDPSKLDTNDGSITMRVVYGKTSFMLTGDLTTKIEDWLLVLDKNDGELDVDVLKVGHHGSKYSTGDAWLAALSPSTVAISVGAHNSYGHPTSEVLGRITSVGASILRTDQDGRIVFKSNGVVITK